MIDIIIPSAKLIPIELQNIGKLPAIIYPINEGIVFDYLFKQYADISSSIDIICYEKADKIHRRLANYKSSKINIIDIPQLDDLGHTIYYGLKDTHTPIIINFADTIISDILFNDNMDSFYYSEDYRSDRWTFFRMKEGYIEDIFDKSSSIDNHNTKEKLFVGVFLLSDCAEFKKCLEQVFTNKIQDINSFYQALQLYSELHPMSAIQTDNWLDIGHKDKYFKSELEVKARQFNHIKVDKERGILTKYSDDKDKFIGEIKWYLKLPADIEYVSPRIFDYSTSYINPYISMEYYAYHTVHELFLYGDLSFYQWTEIFNRIRFICNDFKRYTVIDVNIRPALEEMYLTKTIQRLDKLKTDKRFNCFFGQVITINGTRYKSLDKICSILRQIIPEMLYDVEKFNIIHGDLCFTNMMVDSNLSFIKIIDPRGKFGPFDIYGDYRYELAKLFHSVDGKYDFIIKDLFSIDYDLQKAIIIYQIFDRQREFNLYKVFTDVFKFEIGNDLKKIELIEALLFLSMIPLHGESLNHQLIMLGTGLDILNRLIDITEK